LADFQCIGANTDINEFRDINRSYLLVEDKQSTAGAARSICKSRLPRGQTATSRCKW